MGISSLKNLENFFIVAIALSFFFAHNVYVDLVSGVSEPVFYFYLRPGLLACLGVMLVAFAAKSLMRRDAVAQELSVIEDQSFELGDTTDIEGIIASRDQVPQQKTKPQV